MAVAIREGRSVRGQEMIVERPDGTRSYVVPYPDPIREPSGALGGAVTVLLDITERRQAEQALRKREGQLEEAQDLAHFGSWDRDIAAGKLTWSDEVYRIFGRAREEFTLSHDAFWELVHPEDRARAQDAVHEALAGGKSYNTEFRIIRPDGSARLVHSRGRVTKDNAGRPIRMFGVLQDVTERKEVEDELIKTKARLETLSRRLLETNEAELRRIARELHDEIGQSLTAAKLEIQASKRTTDPAALSLRLDDSLALVEHLLESVRELSLNLRPASLDALGMVGALRAHFTTHATRAGLTLRFETDDFSETFDPAIEMACFRVAQEALTNILRHARATSVTIELRRPDHELRLRVCDDGAGFDFAAAMARAEGGGTFGLLSMRERVELSGGVFTCVSTLGKGTEIRGSFPIARGGSASATKS
jgi:PAS domain S-box-containing protein